MNSIKADLLKNMKRVRQLTHSNSTINLNQQLGVRGRPRLKRNNNVNARAGSRARSVSRNRAGLTRTNSVQNVRERSASRQRKPAPIRLKRSNSQLITKGQLPQRGQNRSLRQQRGRSRSNIRQTTSVNSRLQTKRQNNNNQNGRNAKNSISSIRRGRITKNNGQQRQKRRQLIKRFLF